MSIVKAIQRLFFLDGAAPNLMPARVDAAADELIVETALLSREVQNWRRHPDPLGALVHHMQNEKTKRQAIDRGVQGNVAGATGSR